MRLGISTALKHTTPKEWAEKMELLGCKAVVFPVDCTASDLLVADYMNEAKKHDLLIAEVGIWKNVFAVNPKEREEAREYARRQLRLADEIGAVCCVNVAGTFGGPIWDGGYPENFSTEAWSELVSYTKKLIDEVRPHRVKYSIEPMPWMYPTGPDEYLRLEKDINREEFGIHFDFVNMINSPQRYFHINEFMQECFDKIGDRILSCHLKDIRLKRELTFQLEETNCGNGILDIEQLIQHLQNYNHDMPVIIEHLDTDEEYLKSLTYVKKRLQNANVVVDGSLGNMHDPLVILTLAGLLITGILVAKNKKGALLISIVAISAIGMGLKLVALPQGIMSFNIPSLKPVFLQLFSVDKSQIFSLDMVIVVFTLLFVDLFDTVGCLVGVAEKGNLLDEDGNIPRAKEAMLADAIGTTVGALIGTSTVTAFIESAAGIGEGGKTGLTAITTGVLFLLSLFFAPLFVAIPTQATSAVLIIVGVMMAGSLNKIDFGDFTNAIPAFITFLFMPLMNSIGDGIIFGILSYTILTLAY